MQEWLKQLAAQCPEEDWRQLTDKLDNTEEIEMSDTLNNHSTESDSQSGYEKLIAECEAESEKPLLDKLLEDYTQEQFSADIADYILADRDNSELQRTLKEAVWWDKNMCGLRRDLVGSFGNEVFKLAAIGREVLKNLYATTEGK